MPFSKKATVVRSRCYRHPVSGRTFSLFSSYVEPGSVISERGWTISWCDGTVGTCRPAWVTQRAAQAWADAWNEGKRSLADGLPPMPGMKVPV